MTEVNTGEDFISKPKGVDQETNIAARWLDRNRGSVLYV